MRDFLKISFVLLLLSQLSFAQVVTLDGFEQDEMRKVYNLQDSASMQPYFDSLQSVHEGELLTGFLNSTLHEPLAQITLEYSIDGETNKKLTADSLGRFYIRHTQEIDELSIHIQHNEFHPFDSVYSINGEKKILGIDLTPKYKIVLRGRVFAGNMPIEGVDVSVRHNSTETKLSTLNCYTDDENYWNCLYLGMFKQIIHFENPEDSVVIELSKEGFRNTTHALKVKEYDGTVIRYKLRYEKYLPAFPKHTVSLRFGHTFSNAWGVGIQYVRQVQLGNFNRFGIGVEGSMLTNKISTELSTFENVSSTTAIDYYTSGFAGGVVNIAVTNPLHRYVNINVGAFIGATIPTGEFNVQPYLSGKFFLDINKALVWDVRYLNYSLDQNEYTFNPYGSANESIINKEYSKMLYSLGLLVSFNIK